MTRNKKKNKENKYLYNRRYPFYFLIGALVLYTIFYVIPGLAGIALSFTDWRLARGIDQIKFIGLDNFKLVFSQEENYFKYLLNTLRFALVTSVFKTILALGVALILNSKIRFKNFHRLAMFFPSIVSVLVTGLIFKSILNPQKGLINVALRAIGLESLTTDWLNGISTSFNTVMSVDIWKGIGYIMVIFLAGLQSIPKDYYEASSIDGANYFQNFIYVTFPMLKSTIIVTCVLNIIYGLRVFDIVYVLTKGGPGDLTDVMYTSVFREFGLGNYALGSAISSVMLCILGIIGFFSIRLITKKENEYE